MRLLLAACLFICGESVRAEERVTDRAAVDQAIRRGLTFLTKDALAWKEKHQCNSCHHAALVVSAMREAKRRGHIIEEPVLAELTKWMAESGEGKTSVPRPPGIPKAVNTKAIYYASALGIDPQRDKIEQTGLEKMIGTVKDDQLENGSWAAWPETRPPIFVPSDDTATVSATLALLPLADSDPAAKSAIERSVRWLSENPTDGDPQSVALRVILWSRLGRPTEEITPLIARIRERQNSDGGWSQTNEMPSDAWATGQALYALAHAGAETGDAAVVRGQKFLVNSQKDDGSWPMTSRPIKPGGEGSKSLVPIVGAGSSWGVLGLVRSR
ncbi:MAG: prenyltransferase/squalene oxidase repeat-containing protein [Planctomycetaceae bacterium]